MTRTNGLTPCGSVADLASYDHILVFLSGGKDSIDCLDPSWRLVLIPHGSSCTIMTWTAPDRTAIVDGAAPRTG
jgi:hypothetical protein